MLQDIKAIKEEHTQEDEKPIPSGVIPLSYNKDNKGGKESWDSYEEMIDDLQRAEASGQKNAKLILNQLFHKSMVGQAQPFKKMVFKGKVDELGKERGLFETLRMEFRRRKLAEKKKRDAQNE